MPAKRAPKAPTAPARIPAKKAPRPASTKKKQAPPKPANIAKVKKQKPLPAEVTLQLQNLLKDSSASAQSIVDFIVGPSCGLESVHAIGCTLKFKNLTPFLLAVEANRLDVVQLLVTEHPANACALAQGKVSALHIASMAGHLEMARYLVKRCGLDAEAGDKDIQTALHWAIYYSHSSIASLFLERGVSPNLLDNNRQTPLHFASIYGMFDIVRLLIAKGADVNAAQGGGMTSLYWAIFKEHSEIALLLLESGADPNLSDVNKQSPLHLACERGLVDLAQKLIERGAERAAVNSQGKTPLDLATASQYSELAALLGISS